MKKETETFTWKENSLFCIPRKRGVMCLRENRRLFRDTRGKVKLCALLIFAVLAISFIGSLSSVAQNFGINPGLNSASGFSGPSGLPLHLNSTSGSASAVAYIKHLPTIVSFNQSTSSSSSSNCCPTPLIPPNHLNNSQMGSPTGTAPLHMQNPSLTLQPSPQNTTATSFSDPPELGLQKGWFGLDATNPRCSSGCAPSDVDVAASPGYVFETVNVWGEIWTTTGSFVSYVNLTQLFGGITCCDTHVIYDSLSGSWFVTGPSQSSSPGHCNPCYIAIAVSNNANPLLGWYYYHIQSSYYNSQNFFDDPVSGVSSDKFAITAGTQNGNEFFVFNKADLRSGEANWVDYAPNSNWSQFVSSQALTSMNTMWIVCNMCGDPSNELYLYSLTGVPGNGGLTLTQYSVSIRAMNLSTIDVPQKGTSQKLVDIGSNPWLPKVQGSDLWVPFTEACKPSGDSTFRDCIRFIEINTSSESAIQDWDSAVSGQYFFYPALSLDSYGDLYAEYGFANSNNYVTLVYGSQTVFDPRNTLSYALYLSLGPTGPTLSGRAGDFFAVSTDPTNPKLVWAGGQWEYASGSSNYWSTYIQSFAVGTWVQSEVTCGSTGTGSATNCGAITGAPDGNLANLHAGNYQDTAYVVGDFGSTFSSGTLLIDGYSYYNSGCGGCGYKSEVTVQISSDDSHWTQIYDQTWNPYQPDVPYWIVISSVSMSFRYVKVTAEDVNGYSANIYIDSIVLS